MYSANVPTCGLGLPIVKHEADVIMESHGVGGVDLAPIIKELV
jgi:hypothetical protein